MAALAVDVSNFTEHLDVPALQAAGIELVIAQAVSPPPGYPPSVIHAQLEACRDAGMPTDAYVWLWFDLDVSDIQAKLALLDGYPIRRIWLDVEDTSAEKHPQADCEAKVAAALAACDAYPTISGERTGVYTGGWFWTDVKYMGNTTAFSDRDLWDADYDDVIDTILGFVPYGGWTSRAIKQYRGSTTRAGVSGIDLNVLSDEEAAKLMTGCDTYKAAIERAVNRLQIELDRKTAKGASAAVRRALIKQIASELFGALQ